MRWITILTVVLVAGASARADVGSSEVHEAKTSIGLAGTVVTEASTAALVELHGGYRVARKLWLDLALGRGTAGLFETEGIDEVAAYEARGGTRYLSCGKALCGGLQLMLGYHRQQVVYSPDFLVDPDGYTMKRHDVFGEGRIVGRARLLQGWLALELSLGARTTYATVNRRTGEDDRTTCFVASFGVFGTI